MSEREAIVKYMRETARALVRYAGELRDEEEAPSAAEIREYAAHVLEEEAGQIENGKHLQKDGHPEL